MSVGLRSSYRGGSAISGSAPSFSSTAGVQALKEGRDGNSFDIGKKVSGSSLGLSSNSKTDNVSLLSAIQSEFAAYQHEITLLKQKIKSLEQQIEAQHVTHTAQLHDLRKSHRAEIEYHVEEIDKHRKSLEGLNTQSMLNDVDAQQKLERADKARENLQSQVINGRKERTKLENEVVRLRQEGQLKDSRLREFDEKSAKLQQQVLDAMKALQQAFHGFSEEEQRRQNAEAKLFQVENHRDQLLQAVDDLKQNAGYKEGRLSLGNKSSGMGKSPTRSEPPDSNVQLVKVLQQEVQSLRQKLVENMGMQRTR